MSRYGIPVTPRNYAVWYEYVSGTNAALKAAIDGLIEGDATINDAVISRLHKEFVDQADVDKLRSAQHNLHVIAQSITRSLDAASCEVTRYEASLNTCSSKLTGDVSTEQLQAIVSDLSTSTQKMANNSVDLQRSLEESQREADALRAELEKAREEAKTDAMTGLANRKAFMERIAEMDEDGDRATGEHCLLIADIDNFKRINDTYGHLFGDRVIRTVAQTIKRVIKGKDLVARFGGEEFVVLLPDTPLEGAGTVAETIRRTIETSRIVNQRTGAEISRVTISIGITQLSPDEDVDESLGRADAALYLAKENGRNCIEMHPPHAIDVAVAGSRH